MSLFQPTNVTPSVFGPAGSGVVDANHDLTVSWQINGNSAMTAFEIEVFTNDINSTPLYDTGKLTANCPFYGTKANGDIQFFSYTIPAGTIPPPSNSVSSTGSVTGVTCNYSQFAQKTGSQTGTLTFYCTEIVVHGYVTYWTIGPSPTPISLKDLVRLDDYGISYDALSARQGDTITVSMTAGYDNGASYKTKITQWWSETESVTQLSGNVFQTRATPELTMGAIPSPVTGRSNTFSAQYTQAQGDALSWARWQIAVSNDTENPLYDTGKVFGTADLSITYDGFIPNLFYSVRCSGETESGSTVDTGWIIFPVQYDTNDTGGHVTASCSKGDGVAVAWSSLFYIMGAGEGTWAISGEKLNLDSDGSVTWDTVSGDAMRLQKPWSIFYKGTLVGKDAALISAETENGTFSMDYDKTTRTLTLRLAGSALAAKANISDSSEITAVITPDKLYLRVKEMTGGLYPGEALFPSSALYPETSDIVTVNVYEDALLYQQGDIRSLSLRGAQVADWLYVCMSGQESAYIAAAMDGTFSPAFDEIAYFCADFSSGLNAGDLKSSDPLTGVSVYRKKSSDKSITYITTLPLNQKGLIDRSVTNGNTYVYYVFPESENAFSFAPLISNGASPCYWDWVLLECAGQSDGSYLVKGEYHFGKNLSTGSMGNNNAPNILKNFTRYPLVQKDPANYKSGTLTSLIGAINGQTGEYADSLALRNMLFELSTTENTLFLKSRKGDLLKVALSSEISVETMDNTRQQAQSATVSWVEIGSAENAVILGTGDMPKASFGGQTKTVSPSFARQVITPDEGYGSLTSVIVEPISVVKEPNAAGGYTVTIGQ